MLQIALGALLAAVVAGTALRVRALTLDGAAAAFAVGTAVFGAAGWQGALVLFAFFIPSTLLSRVGRARKRALSDVGKQGPRDAWQVLANGGVAALCAALAPRFGLPLAAACAGAFAAASADTWATEIGTLARGKPRSILTFRPIPTGLSGGITAAGTLASAGGAVCVALAAWSTGFAPLVAVAVAGFAGSLVDSVLGASLQAMRWCPTCQRECETDPHVCGTPTQLRRGVAWAGNDAINFAATISGAAIAMLIAR